MSLNLAHCFVRYPDVLGISSTVSGYLTTSILEKGSNHRVVLVAVPGGWIGAYAEGNNLGPGLAQFLSRALEAESVWFGLAGRSLAYRIQRFKLGKRIEEVTEPAGLFGPEGPSKLPLYPDAEERVFTRLAEIGIPEPYRFLHAEELGANGAGPHDAVQIRIGPDGTDEQTFAHRPPAASANGIVRTLFDRVDEAASLVEDDLVLRGAHDAERGRALFATLRKILERRLPPSGWSFRFAVESPEGPALLDPLLAQYAAERRAGHAPFDMVRAPI
jgi:hypothetical protein